jgi:hypothetical protein
LAPNAPVLLVEEEYRQRFALEADFGDLETIIVEAWPPFDDLYIVPPDFSWCIVLTHEDSLGFHRASETPMDSPPER